MRNFVFGLALVMGLLSVIAFAYSWLGPVNGEGYGRGITNILVMLGSGAVSLLMVILVSILRLTSKDPNSEAIWFMVSLGVNVVPVLGVCLMFLGTVRIH